LLQISSTARITAEISNRADELSAGANVPARASIDWIETRAGVQA